MLLSADLHPTGFRINGSPVGATYAHIESFRPTYTPSQYSYRADGSKDLVYWDSTAYVEIHNLPGYSSLNGAERAAAAKSEKPAAAAANGKDQDAAFFESLETDIAELGKSTGKGAPEPKSSERSRADSTSSR